MKKCLLLLIMLCTQLSLFAQQDAWVYLTDKQNVSSSISNPITILSQKTIDRKNVHGVIIDARDVPVNETYISQLKSATGITVMAKSKWFNAVHVRGSETDIKNLTSTFSFINNIDFADKSLTLKTVQQKKQSKLENIATIFNYGSAANQIQMIKGDKLHVANYTGTGMTVAVLDAGFPNVNTMSSFSYLRNAGNILGGYDFVNRNDNVYLNNASSHGTWVLSTMAGYIQDQYVGTAPDAAYYLFITEDAPTENPVEESYWVEAAERADSLGVDVINTSLGYTPADATGVLTVGAVKADGTYASFSSVGSSIQPTQKPDVAAQGQASVVIDINDVIVSLDGTSFSSPILAGGIVCLWEALPNLNNNQIIQLVRESASQYNNPDYSLGYGIPNLELALNNALSLDDFLSGQEFKLFPNPTKGPIYLSNFYSDNQFEIGLYDMIGKKVFDFQLNTSQKQIDISFLSNGVYIAKIQSKGKSKMFKIVKN
ncbi:S8 family peptidase [Yeosuana sp.]|uniref:S8 family peptidase n=1 Tax=Yeosuana sp. TaxID=2529388 RepID=UPI004054C16E